MPGHFKELVFNVLSILLDSRGAELEKLGISLTKATAIRQYYLGFNCLNDNNQLDKCILKV